MKSKLDIYSKLELNIQQEIKNYNDSLSGIHILINTLNEKISHVNDKCEKKLAIIDGDLTLKNITIENLKININENNKHISSTINDQSHIKDYIYSHISIIIDSVSRLLTTIDTQKDQITNLYEEIHRLKSQMEFMKSAFNDSINDTHRRLKLEIIKTKHEIMEAPSQYEEDKAQLEGRINSHIVDVQGLYQEMRALRKDAMITEKKIENIYTLIERLKKSGEQS